MFRRKIGLSTNSAFSLAEVLVAVSIFAIFLGLVAANLKQPNSKAQPRALAELLTEELKAARLEAMAKGVPVAIALPSDNGSKPVSCSFYRIRGNNNPKTEKVYNYENEFPKARFFVGTWTGASLSPDAANFRADQWLAPQTSRDFLFIFQSDGSVATNDLPYSAGAYHVLTGTGVTYAGGSLSGGACSPAPGYYQASAVADPYTIDITSAGAISMHSGLPAGSGLVESASAQRDPLAAAPTWVLAGNSAPVIANAKILPAAGMTPSSGADGYVAPGGRLNLVTYATDPNGDDLFVHWRALNDATGSPAGSFAIPAAAGMAKDVRMSWRGNQWVNVSCWTPPRNDPAGTVYRFDSFVTDERGNQVQTSGTATLQIELNVDEKITFSVGSELFWMTPRENDWHRIGNGGTHPSLSPNKTKIVFNSSSSGRISTCNLDGTDLRQLANAPLGFIRAPQWSPDGGRIFYTIYSDPIDMDVFVMNADGTNPRQLTRCSDVYMSGYLMLGSVAPDGQSLLVCGHQPGTPAGQRDIILVTNLGAAIPTQTNLTNGVGQNDAPIFHPHPTDPNKAIYFTSDRSGSPEIWTMAADGSNPAPTNFAAGSTTNSFFTFSPNGSKILTNLASMAVSSYIDPATGAVTNAPALYRFTPQSWR